MNLISRNKLIPESSPTLFSCGESSSLFIDEESVAPRTVTPPSISARKKDVGPNPPIALLRKLCITVFGRNTIRRNTFFNIFKDLIAGTLLGIALVFFLFFLDYHNFIHLGSARAFRDAAFYLVMDPNTIRYVEYSLGLKFISVDIYNAKNDELKRMLTKIKNKQRDIVIDQKKINEILIEAAPFDQEYDELMTRANNFFELDKFCANCKFKGSTTCGGRMDYLMEKYGDSLLKSKIAVLSFPQCKK